MTAVAVADKIQRLEHRLPLSQLIADHTMNISRAGKRHDPDAIKQLAERIIDTGQTTTIEVFRFADDPTGPDDPWRIASGFGRWEAASYIEAKIDQVEWGLYDGELRATELPIELIHGKSAEEILVIVQNRNLDENIHRNNLSLIDEALAVIALTTPADKGGRGEDIRLVGQRMSKSSEQLHKMRNLGKLSEDARQLVRQNFRDKDLGLNEVQAYKLANKPEEEQLEIIAKAKDASGRVTPKAVQAVINPHSGRQGQPEVVTGAQITTVNNRLERVLKSPSELGKKKVTKEQLELVINVLAAIRDRTDEAFAKLPGQLGSLIKNELSKG